MTDHIEQPRTITTRTSPAYGAQSVLTAALQDLASGLLSLLQEQQSRAHAEAVKQGIARAKARKAASLNTANERPLRSRQGSTR